MTRPFTGRHMFLILAMFFGVVILINVVMARFAISTFGGTVVDNSYVASQRFNGWLAEARRQRALGWTVLPGIDAQRRVTLLTGAEGTSLSGLTINAIASHPLGRSPDMVLRLVPVEEGHYRSITSLPAASGPCVSN